MYYIRFIQPCNTFLGCRQSFLEHHPPFSLQSIVWTPSSLGTAGVLERKTQPGLKKREIDIPMGLWYSMDIIKGDINRGSIKKGGKSDMDKESREFLEKRFLILAQKDDVEKLRQETKSSLSSTEGRKQDADPGMERGDKRGPGSGEKRMGLGDRPAPGRDKEEVRENRGRDQDSLGSIEDRGGFSTAVGQRGRENEPRFISRLRHGKKPRWISIGSTRDWKKSRTRPIR